MDAFRFLLVVSLFLALEATHAPRALAQTVPYFSQLDGKWANDTMGQSGLKVKTAGCTMTCCAMLLVYYGVDTDPGRLNAWLSANGGYTTGGLLNWPKPADFSGGKMQWIVRSTYRGYARDSSLLNDELGAGHPVIANVHKGAISHWVLITGRNGSDYKINDPYWNYTSLSSFGSYIYGMGVYHGTPADDSAGWEWIPGRSTRLPFAAVDQYGFLNIIHVGLDNRKMYLGNKKGGNWSSWSELPGETDDAPSITAWANVQLYGHRGLDNRVNWLSYDPTLPEGQQWNGWNPIDRWTSAAPSMQSIPWGQHLWFIHKGADNNNMYVGLRDFFSGQWFGWWQLSGFTPDRPGLAVFNGDLWAIHRGLDNNIYVKNLALAFDGGWISLGGTTQSAPSMVEYNGRLYVIHRGDANKIYRGYMEVGGKWSGWEQLPGETLMQPILFVFNNQLYAGRVGLSGKMYIRQLIP